MFLFSWCMAVENNEVYELRTKNSKNQMVRTLETDITKLIQMDIQPHTQVIKIIKSDYQKLTNDFANSLQKWTDQEFPPNQSSFGQIEQIKFHEWKRISEIIQYPVLFDGRIEPQDVIQGELGDCYFLSAVAALAEKQQRIKHVFGDQKYNKNGIYKVTLRINGVVKEILIDDFIPVNEHGVALFCQPNKNEFWIPLLEKAWAKANGSYSNIIAGSPTQIFKAITYAPSEVFYTKNTKQENQKLWKIILESAKKNFPCCCGTSDRQDINWHEINLVAEHAYSLIHAAQLEDKKGVKRKILKIRNPWANTEWEGQGNENDKKFWNTIYNSEEKQEFLRECKISNDGVFFMTFEDYIKYFEQTHISYTYENGNYISEKFYCNRKKGTYWSLKVAREGEHWIEIHQTGVRFSRQTSEILSRATILVIRVTKEGYQFVEGCLKYYEEDSSLKVNLLPGDYLVFTKLDPSLKTSQLPQGCQMSIYSLQFTTLYLFDNLKKNILREVFLSHGRQNKRQKFQNNTMWLSWKLLFKEGGYAYIAFGNEKGSKQKFVITFNESDFINNNFKLKKPFKGKGENQRIEVLPGSEQIILTRIKNGPITKLKFPPPFDWKIIECQ